MDQIIVDVTHVGSVSVGDEAVVLGSDGEESISADELAVWAGTISYEIVCQLGHNLPKKFCS
jgi:alanine racemase